MKAIVVTDQAAGTTGMKLATRPKPAAAINDVLVQVHASGFTSGDLTWPSTWTDRFGRDRTPSIPGQELGARRTTAGEHRRHLDPRRRRRGFQSEILGLLWTIRP
jgi:D-arabinose 1-dehydrogenase-like Zn-dependent alcohol dehydrogenase